MKQENPTVPETGRIFPEDDDALYREMTVHMPGCYFPTSLSEDGIHEFAGEEFHRIRNIVCRHYNFNEDKYIQENASVSPFDSVQDNFEMEVYRRIRKDYVQLSVISIRESLLRKIRHAVEKENNIIGTFYRNRGVHYRESESPEYETSPIVVVHNPVFTDTAVTKVRQFMNFSSTGTANCSARSTVRAARILMSLPKTYRPKDCLISPTGWKNTGLSLMILMTTGLPYATSAVQTISRHRHGWIRIPAYSLALRALTVRTTGVTNARTICPLPRLKNLRNVCRNGGIRWIQIRWRRLQATVRTSVRHL